MVDFYSTLIGLAVIAVVLILMIALGAMMFNQTLPEETISECPTTIDEVTEMYGFGDWVVSSHDYGYRYELDELTDEHGRTFDLPAGSTLTAYWAIVPLQGESGGLGLLVAGPAHPELVVDSDSDSDSVFSNLYIICE